MWIVAAVIVLAATLFWFNHRRSTVRITRAEEERSAQQRKHEEDEHRKKFDHQLNIGRQVYNWLVDNFGQGERSLKIVKMEDNGGKFSIFVQTDDLWPSQCPIMQISFNFFEADSRVTGHIHYGAYGTDVWFNADDRLVMGSIHKVAEPFLKDELDLVRFGALRRMDLMMKNPQ